MKTFSKFFVLIIVDFITHSSHTNAAIAAMSLTSTTPKTSIRESLTEPITLHAMVRDIMFADMQESQKIFDQIQQSAKNLEADFAHKAHKIKQENAQKNKALQQRAEKKSRIIFDEYAQQAAIINQETDAQLIDLKRKATEKLLSLISHAEEESLIVKQQERQKILEKKLIDLEKKGTLATWKEQLHKDFVNDTEYLKDIIAQGESSDQIQDFMKHFDAQATWFDKTLSSTQHQTDDSYYQLNQKKIALDNVVSSHRAAEILLKERLLVLGKEPQNSAKMRLMLLYDINNLIQNKNDRGIAAATAAILSPQEINNIVNNVIQTSELKTYQPTAPVALEAKIQSSSQNDKDLLSLTTELEKTKRLLEKETRSQMELKKFAQQKIEQGSTAHFDLEAQLKQTQSKLEREKQKYRHIKDQQLQLKQEVGIKLERLAKENLELQTIIFDTNQKLLRSQQKLAAVDMTIETLQKNIQQQNKQTLESINRIGLIDELANKRAKEYLLQFDIKRTLVTESEKEPTLDKTAREKINRLELEQELEERISQAPKR